MSNGAAVPRLNPPLFSTKRGVTALMEEDEIQDIAYQ
jgi:hypothetical protein